MEYLNAAVAAMTKLGEVAQKLWETPFPAIHGAAGWAEFLMLP